jgi:hypothetical protein
MREVVITGETLGQTPGSGVETVLLSLRDEYGSLQAMVLQPTFPLTLQLEAWRDGRDHDGWTYTITITATDRAGNIGMAEAIVTVAPPGRASGSVRTAREVQ